MNASTKPKQQKQAFRVSNVLGGEDRQPMTPRICDDCYDMLMESISTAAKHTMVAVHCPHYMVLMEVELHEDIPLGVVMTGPITQEEAGAKINNQFDFD